MNKLFNNYNKNKKRPYYLLKYSYLILVKKKTATALILNFFEFGGFEAVSEKERERNEAQDNL